MLAATALGPLGRHAQTPLLAGALLWTPALLLGLRFARVHRDFDAVSPALATDQLLIVGAVLVFFAGTAALSATTGALLWSSLLLATALVYGRLLRASPSAPFVLLVLAGAVGLALPFARGVAQMEVLGAAAGLGLFGQLILGRSALVSDQRRDERARYEAALHAQAEAEAVSKVETLEEVLGQLMGSRHDLKNSFMALRLTGDLLVKRVSAGVLDEKTAAELEESLDGFEEHLTAMLSKKKALSASRGALAEVTAAKAVLEAVASQVARQHPGASVVLDCDEAQVVTRGGKETLDRIVRNLLLNALQGDGQSSASTLR